MTPSEAPFRRLLAATALRERRNLHGLVGWLGGRWLSLDRRRHAATPAREAEIDCLAGTSLFDAEYYLASNPDVKAAGLDPRRHYLDHGAAERRDPSPWFGTAFYLARNPDVLAAGTNPLVHYVMHGAREGRLANFWFDPAFYLARYPDVAAAGVDPLVHYAEHGAREGRLANWWFDPTFYVAQYPDVAASGVNPLLHYVEHGASEGRLANWWFDPAFYVARYPDVAAGGVDPLLHYVEHGASEGRHPNPWFDPAFYLSANPEVGTPGRALEHFLSVGLAGGCRPNAAFDARLYLAANPDVAVAGADALRHYVTTGFREGRQTAPSVPASDYSAMKREIALQRAAAIGGLQPERPVLVAFAPEQWAQAAESLAFERVEQPQVSVVIPAFNQAGHTLECLVSLSRSTDGVPFEVILFDNASTDPTPQLFASVPNLVCVRSERNMGFVLACNEAAKLARGTFIVFLNNDTQVASGWLRSLMETFRQHERVGAVGPKVLYPDGRLQEAGGHVGPDAASELIGTFEDPCQPRYNRVRDVDYCSGVCLMLEASRFRQLGGFDPRMSPAYYEDVDLCLRLRAEGLRVLYDPGSVIVHHLSATANSLDEDYKVRCVARNRQRIVEKHQALLDDLNRVRLVAFYLPQFHPIPENDRWWGKGFTEWRNVAQARPNFEGHEQPRIPADLGFYDLRLPQVMRAQTALARRYGIYGFCYYYYWFAGKRLLETPLEMRLEDRDNDFPFCLAWANENWTRTWDGLEDHVLIGQRHSDEDDAAVIRDLLRYVAHPAYIRIAGRPLLLVYRASLFPDVRKTMRIWRDVARSLGVGEIYLAMVESFEEALNREDPVRLGFDASVEFPPHHTGYPIEPPGASTNPRFKGRVHDYRKVVLRYTARQQPGHTRFRAVIPGWDNTPRRQDDAEVFACSSPGAYRAWLEHVIRETLHQNSGEERLVFVNAWNEWAEGAYLEPDSRLGHAYLEATRAALDFGPLDPW